MTREETGPLATRVVDSVPPFNLLPADVKKRLALRSKIYSVGAQELIAKTGSYLKGLVYVLDGELGLVWTLANQKNLSLGGIIAGRAIGWVELFDQRPLDCSIVAAKKSTIFVVPLSELDQLVKTDASIASYVAEQMAFLVRNLEQQQKALLTPNAYQRVYVRLFDMLERGKTPQLMLPKQEDLARMANTSRETVSRALQLLVKNGVALKQGRMIQIKKVAMLKKAVDLGVESLQD